MSARLGWVVLVTSSAGFVLGCGATRRNVDDSDRNAPNDGVQGGTTAEVPVPVAAGSSGTQLDSGTSTETPDELLESCTQLAEKWCERIEACSPTELASRYGYSAYPGASSCVIAERDRCVDWFSNVKGVANGVDAVLAAAPTSCAQAFEYYPPYRTGAQGELAPGDACKWDEQCASGYCARSFDELCGSCDFIPPRGEPATGQPCAERACPTPLVCDPVEMICVQPPGEGQACLQLGGSPSPYDYCAAGLFCAAGECVAPLFFGEACSSDRDRCDVLHGLACQDGKCGPAAPLHVEGSCGGYPNQGSCGADDTCVYAAGANPAVDDRPGQCEPRQTGAGTPCAGPTDCPTGLQCVPGGDIGAAGGSGKVGPIGFCRPLAVNARCE